MITSVMYKDYCLNGDGDEYIVRIATVGDTHDFPITSKTSINKISINDSLIVKLSYDNGTFTLIKEWIKIFGEVKE